MTAGDVAATYERHADKSSSLSTSALLTGLPYVKATAPNEVTFELASPNVDWPIMLSVIVPRSPPGPLISNSGEEKGARPEVAIGPKTLP